MVRGFFIGGKKMTVIRDGAGSPLGNGGTLATKPYAFADKDWQAASAAIIDTTNFTLKAALASNRNYVTGIQFINTSAVPTEIVIKDNVTVIWRGFAPANMTQMVDIQFNTPLRGTAGVAMYAACITTGTNTYISAQGYQSTI
jgi:hypothetical protein